MIRAFLHLFLATLLLFSTSGNGVLVLCIGDEGHMAFEVQGTACPTSTQESHDCSDNDIHYDAVNPDSHVHSDCADFELLLSEFRKANRKSNNHSTLQVLHQAAIQPPALVLTEQVHPLIQSQEIQTPSLVPSLSHTVLLN